MSVRGVSGRAPDLASQCYGTPSILAGCEQNGNASGGLVVSTAQAQLNRLPVKQVDGEAFTPAWTFNPLVFFDVFWYLLAGLLGQHPN